MKLESILSSFEQPSMSVNVKGHPLDPLEKWKRCRFKLTRDDRHFYSFQIYLDLPTEYIKREPKL